MNCDLGRPRAGCTQQSRENCLGTSTGHIRKLNMPMEGVMHENYFSVNRNFPDKETSIQKETNLILLHLYFSNTNLVISSNSVDLFQKGSSSRGYLAPYIAAISL